MRLSLINIDEPVYNAFVLECVEPKARNMVPSLYKMAWKFGWAFNLSISGWLQARDGFGPFFLLGLMLFSISVHMYWKVFWKKLATPDQPGYSSILSVTAQFIRYYWIEWIVEKKIIT